MRGRDIKIGETYLAKVSGQLVPVRITSASIHGGWNAVNTTTGREVRFRSGGRLRAGHIQAQQQRRPNMTATNDLKGKHVILDGQKETILDAGEDRTDDKGYRVVRVEFASGKVCDLLVPVQTCE
jgi:hypothetical protein